RRLDLRLGDRLDRNRGWSWCRLRRRHARGQHVVMAGDGGGELLDQHASSLISPTTAWMRSLPAEFADTTRPSTAASRRPNSATWRARSAVPRDRPAIWPPTSERSRSRIDTAL